MPAASPPLVRLIVAALTLALVVPLTTAAPASATDHQCTLDQGPGYSVNICLTGPDVDPAGSTTVRGDLPVAVEVSVLPGAAPVLPTVSKVVFSYRDEYVLTDHYAPYGMTWKTTRLVDGPGVFEVKVRLSDDRVARHVAPLTLANGVTTAPVNTKTFTVRTGTQPPAGQRFRLAAVGDAAGGTTPEKQIAAQIASWSPNMFAYLGDVYERGSAFEFDNWYADPAGLGQFRSITNPTIGNHEYLTPGASGYFDYWDNVPRYYSYDVAGWRVVSIDSTDDFAQLRPGTAQYEWLAANLAANRARCTLVYMHHPRYAVSQGGGRSGLDAVWALMAARRVTLAVAGHAHNYERWQPLDGASNPDERGVTQLVAGAGGHELAPPVVSDPRNVVTLVEPGALRLDLGPEDVRFAYVDVNGVERDSGTIGCKSTGDTLPPAPPSGLLATPLSTTSAQVSWQPTTDTYGTVAGYRVWRNGVLVATLGAGTTTYTETGLTPGQTYSWTVDAFDDSANYSAQSLAASTTVPSPGAAQVKAGKLLKTLTVRREQGDEGFSARKFRRWTDADGDGCDTRDELLLTEAKKSPTLLPVCRLRGGRWYSAYDGYASGKRRTFGIESHVPLREAWESGAKSWTAWTRKGFANDLGYLATLNVASDRVLGARGSREPQSWLPPRASTRCAYVAEWVAVKWRWKLAVNKAEKVFLRKRLNRCGWPAVPAPTRAIVNRR